MAARPPIKVLSDFDGVWTDQAFEAEQVKLYLAAEAARLARVPADAARAHFARFEEAVQADPGSFGWAPDGRITAYVDEDPFCVANAVASYVDRAQDDADALRYREAILAHEPAGLSAFADRCFLTSTARFRGEHPPALVPGAREAFEALCAAGAEVVVVSNSSAEKVVGWFRGAGIDAASHEDGHPCALRVRGGAGKQHLGPTQRAITVGGRRILVDRPRYAAVLDEERPDLVIGDVFSLDLALPHVLRGEGRLDARLALRVHPHTPRWILDTRADGAIDVLVDSVAGLLDELERLPGAARA